jgi:CRISPR/Cas system CMR-associated protein Cmr5 small subunit
MLKGLLKKKNSIEKKIALLCRKLPKVIHENDMHLSRTKEALFHGFII